MEKRNKKGVSAVIATLLLVVITIVAVVMVWQFVKKQVIDKNMEEASCSDYREYITILQTDFSCYDTTNDLTKLEIRRSFEAKDIEGISVSISSGDSSEAYELKEGNTEDGVKMYDGSNTIVLPQKGGSKTYIFNGIAGNIVTIAPIVNGKSCDMVRESYTIDEC
jgi:flagellin-like protein